MSAEFPPIDGGIDHVLPSLTGLLFNGVAIGGFVVIGGIGASIGLLVHFSMHDSRMRKHGVRWLTGLSTTTLLLLLATLDWIIGPW